MRILIFFILFLGLKVNAVETHELSFVYQPTGMNAVACKHERIRDLPDWKVTCKDRYFDKEFVAHVVIRRYFRNGETKQTKFEVLYWVTNRRQPKKKNEYTGTTLDFIFDGHVSGQKIRIGQSVDNDYAHLNMLYKPSR